MTKLIARHMKQDSEGLIDEVLCEAISTILEVPGVKGAVASHMATEGVVLESRDRDWNISDLTFQFLWEQLVLDND